MPNIPDEKSIIWSKKCKNFTKVVKTAQKNSEILDILPIENQKLKY
jgi:hypothetical protein